LARDDDLEAPTRPRAAIVTTLSASALLPVVRNVLQDQLRQSVINQLNAVQQRNHLRSCLESVSISRIFDFEGLWEVLGELDSPPEEHRLPGQRPAEKSRNVKHPRTEIQDSDDEDDLSDEKSPAGASPSASRGPDIIVITHTSSLLTALFARREKAAAHNLLQLTWSHLRYLSRSASHGSPLILLLNTTASPAPVTVRRDDMSERSRPLDPTLRSIFDPVWEHAQVSGAYGYGEAGIARGRHTKKPAFGLVFSQMLDLHLLCTRVPRTRADADALVSSQLPPPQFAWVIEVLLDEIGVWNDISNQEGPTEQRRRVRRSREQRWGAVDIISGCRVGDAFPAPVLPEPSSRVRTAGGFGGPRV
jgi:hypothetical protein